MLMGAESQCENCLPQEHNTMTQIQASRHGVQSTNC